MALRRLQRRPVRPYAGQFMPEQEPGGFLPGQIPNLAAWYRSDRGITLGVGAGVAGWADQGSSRDAARNLTQTTAVLQPTYLASDPFYGGKPSLSFNTGLSQYMTSGLWTGATAPETQFIVGNLQAAAINQTLCDGADAETQLIYNNGSATTITTNPSLGAVTVTISSPMVCCAVRAVAGSFRVNKLTANLSGSLSSTARTKTLVGIAGGLIAPLNGKVVEHIVYLRALTEPEIVQVMKYLGGRYNVTLAP
jgi:hypothetical protein